MFEWADTYQVQLRGGWRHRSGERLMGFAITGTEAVSGTFMFELELTETQIVRLLSNTGMNDDEGLATIDLAKEEWSDHWGMKRWVEIIAVPEDIIPAGYRPVEKIKAIIADWFEDLPISGTVDGYAIEHDTMSSMRINTWVWITPEEYDARRALIEESETEDEDAEDFDDDDTGD